MPVPILAGCVSSRRSPSRAVVPFELPPSSYSSQPTVSEATVPRPLYDSPASFIYDVQRGTMDVNPSSRVLSMASAHLRTALPRKVGFHRRPDSRKLLKGWSGRRDSNPRRPAWEYERRL